MKLDHFLLAEIVLYLMFVCCLMIFVYQNRGYDRYRLTKSIQDIFSSSFKEVNVFAFCQGYSTFHSSCFRLKHQQALLKPFSLGVVYCTRPAIMAPCEPAVSADAANDLQKYQNDVSSDSNHCLRSYKSENA